MFSGRFHGAKSGKKKNYFFIILHEAIDMKKFEMDDDSVTRLMASLAAMEIRDYFAGKGNKKNAEASLKLLLEIIADAYPSKKKHEEAWLKEKNKDVFCPYENGKVIYGLSVIGKCPGKLIGEFCIDNDECKIVLY